LEFYYIVRVSMVRFKVLSIRIRVLVGKPILDYIQVRCPYCNSATNWKQGIGHILYTKYTIIFHLFVCYSDKFIYMILTSFLHFSHQKVPKILERNVQKEKKQKERLEKRVL